MEEHSAGGTKVADSEPGPTAHSVVLEVSGFLEIVGVTQNGNFEATAASHGDTKYPHVVGREVKPHETAKGARTRASSEKAAPKASVPRTVRTSSVTPKAELQKKASSVTAKSRFSRNPSSKAEEDGETPQNMSSVRFKEKGNDEDIDGVEQDGKKAAFRGGVKAAPPPVKKGGKGGAPDFQKSPEDSKDKKPLQSTDSVPKPELKKELVKKAAPVKKKDSAFDHLPSQKAEPCEEIVGAKKEFVKKAVPLKKKEIGGDGKSNSSDAPVEAEEELVNKEMPVTEFYEDDQLLKKAESSAEPVEEKKVLKGEVLMKTESGVEDEVSKKEESEHLGSENELVRHAVSLKKETGIDDESSKTEESEHVGSKKELVKKAAPLEKETSLDDESSKTEESDYVGSKEETVKKAVPMKKVSGVGDESSKAQESEHVGLKKELVKKAVPLKKESGVESLKTEKSSTGPVGIRKELVKKAVPLKKKETGTVSEPLLKVKSSAEAVRAKKELDKKAVPLKKESGAEDESLKTAELSTETVGAKKELVKKTVPLIKKETGTVNEPFLKVRSSAEAVKAKKELAKKAVPLKKQSGVDESLKTAESSTEPFGAKKERAQKTVPLKKGSSMEHDGLKEESSIEPVGLKKELVNKAIPLNEEAIGRVGDPSLKVKSSAEHVKEKKELAKKAVPLKKGGGVEHDNSKEEESSTEVVELKELVETSVPLKDTFVDEGLQETESGTKAVETKKQLVKKALPMAKKAVSKILLKGKGAALEENSVDDELCGDNAGVREDDAKVHDLKTVSPEEELSGCKPREETLQASIKPKLSPKVRAPKAKAVVIKGENFKDEGIDDRSSGVSAEEKHHVVTADTTVGGTAQELNSKGMTSFEVAMAVVEAELARGDDVKEMECKDLDDDGEERKENGERQGSSEQSDTADSLKQQGKQLSGKPDGGKAKDEPGLTKLEGEIKRKDISKKPVMAPTGAAAKGMAKLTAHSKAAGSKDGDETTHADAPAGGQNESKRGNKVKGSVSGKRPTGATNVADKAKRLLKKERKFEPKKVLAQGGRSSDSLHEDFIFKSKESFPHATNIGGRTDQIDRKNTGWGFEPKSSLSTSGKVLFLGEFAGAASTAAPESEAAKSVAGETALDETGSAVSVPDENLTKQTRPVIPRLKALPSRDENGHVFPPGIKASKTEEGSVEEKMIVGKTVKQPKSETVSKVKTKAKTGLRTKGAEQTDQGISTDNSKKKIKEKSAPSGKAAKTTEKKPASLGKKAKAKEKDASKKKEGFVVAAKSGAITSGTSKKYKRLADTSGSAEFLSGEPEEMAKMVSKAEDIKPTVISKGKPSDDKKLKTVKSLGSIAARLLEENTKPLAVKASIIKDENVLEKSEPSKETEASIRAEPLQITITPKEHCHVDAAPKGLTDVDLAADPIDITDVERAKLGDVTHGKIISNGSDAKDTEEICRFEVSDLLAHGIDRGVSDSSISKTVESRKTTGLGLRLVEEMNTDANIASELEASGPQYSESGESRLPSAPAMYSREESYVPWNSREVSLASINKIQTHNSLPKELSLEGPVNFFSSHDGPKPTIGTLLRTRAFPVAGVMEHRLMASPLKERLENHTRLMRGRVAWHVVEKQRKPRSRSVGFSSKAMDFFSLFCNPCCGSFTKSSFESIEAPSVIFQHLQPKPLTVGDLMRVDHRKGSFGPQGNSQKSNEVVTTASNSFEHNVPVFSSTSGESGIAGKPETGSVLSDRLRNGTEHYGEQASEVQPAHGHNDGNLISAPVADQGYYNEQGQWVSNADNFGGYCNENGEWVSTANNNVGYYDENGKSVTTSNSAGYYDENGQWVATGDSNGYYNENGQWVSNADSAGYYDHNGQWVATVTSSGYYDENGQWIASANNYAGYYDESGQWVSTAFNSLGNYTQDNAQAGTSNANDARGNALGGYGFDDANGNMNNNYTGGHTNGYYDSNGNWVGAEGNKDCSKLVTTVAH